MLIAIANNPYPEYSLDQVAVGPIGEVADILDVADHREAMRLAGERPWVHVTRDELNDRLMAWLGRRLVEVAAATTPYRRHYWRRAAAEGRSL